ncbi:L-serine ammonia-lyase [uncultured Sphaerochaeta sp.]|uniref:L-serine ammonia-lyase n=1 Tax=uncultured Sphaerochaeta sp. TaxID=886478 RepID=UPI0029CA40E6|nr:L-serine ammonia-lyase [uncultured Sphaerochaeta sp.]
MESLRELYRIGYGPSSSHTMGPRSAAQHFLSLHADCQRFEADLYGSLAATGKGHLTDKALREVFSSAGKDVEIVWYPEIEKPFHPNALTIRSLSNTGEFIFENTYYSVGGGKIVLEGEDADQAVEVYPKAYSKMRQILDYCGDEGMQIWEFALQFEDSGILTYMDEIWGVMCDAIERGVNAEGVLPGGLKLPRKASQFNSKAGEFTAAMGNPAFAISYALAVSEENAGGGKIVTAPTCGSCGVLPGVLYYLAKQYKFPKIRILRALLTAGIIGNVVKTNGSISGAEVGCQGEIGVACAMAGAAATQLLGGSIFQIEYAAEMGLEHHLGLTCDPMRGLVQIPCIERNALATMRSIDHCTYALLGDGRHKVSFDSVIEVMMETGQALPSLYRETSKGGLAKVLG